jgi:hypothetical protein
MVRPAPIKSKAGRGSPHLTASSSIAFSHHEQLICILEQKGMSVTGVCIGAVKDILSYETWIAVKVDQ